MNTIPDDVMNIIVDFSIEKKNKKSKKTTRILDFIS